MNLKIYGILKTLDEKKFIYFFSSNAFEFHKVCIVLNSHCLFIIFL